MARPEELLVANLALIERICRHVASRQRCSYEETDELLGIVRLRLVENDYAILRQFEGKSALATYLTVVISRICIDQRVQQWGRWRPSTEAKRLGPHALELEELIFRDAISPSAAIDTMLQRSPQLDRVELERTLDLLPARSRRPRLESDEALRNVSAGVTADDQIDARESSHSAQRAAELLREATSALEPRDQLILRFRFADAMKIGAIAPLVGIEPARLYKHLDRLLDALRRDLISRGLSEETVTRLLARGTEVPELKLFSGQAENLRPSPSHMTRQKQAGWIRND